MRIFFHKEIDAIVAYIASEGIGLCLVHVDGSVPELKPALFVHRYFEETHSYWGAYPESFLITDEDLSSQKIDIHTAYDLVQRSSSEKFFMLVGYNDGGLFSVTTQILPFQTGAEDASGWIPHRQSGSRRSSIFVKKLFSLMEHARSFFR
jgi:hypothetical protein